MSKKVIEGGKEMIKHTWIIGKKATKKWNKEEKL